MYQALYRKWRPRVFEDVAGQPQITQTLKNEIVAGSVAHAYIFTGSRGTGKTTCAKILAKAVNCLSPHNGDPCNECDSCRGIDAGSILDVVEIDAASNNGVDNIRELREEAVFTPAVAKYRVYIIDEAHMLSGGAFNALLKTLEEPPEYVIFILATTEVHKIPATILSRCQRFDFARIPAADIAARLQFVAQQENIALTENAAALIARLSDGALRDALSLLDRCAGMGPAVDEQLVADAAGMTGRDYLFEIAQAIQKQDKTAVLSCVDRLYANSKDIERVCEELIAHFRSVMIAKTAKDTELIDCLPDEADKIRREAEGFSIESVLHILDVLNSTLETLRRTSSRRVAMEMSLLRICVPELDNSNAALLRRIAALEDKLGSGVIPAPPVHERPASAAVQKTARQEQRAEKPTPQGIKEDQKAPAPEFQTSDVKEEPLGCWPEILEKLRTLDPALCGFLDGSSAIVRDGYVLVDSSNSMFAEMIRQQSHQKPLVEAVRTVTGRPYKVGIFKKSLAASAKAEDRLDEILKSASDAGIGINEQ